MSTFFKLKQVGLFYVLLPTQNKIPMHPASINPKIQKPTPNFLWTSHTVTDTSMDGVGFSFTLKYPVKLVLFAQLHSLFPAVVSLVQVCGDASELQELVLLQTLGEGDVVKVVEGVDWGTESLVIFLVDEETVEGVIDGLKTLRYIKIWN